MRTTSADDLASQLRLSITRTARRLRQEAGTELSPSQRAALATLEKHGPLTPSQLADRERVKRPTISRVITRLEEAGLVARTPDPEDGRSSLVAVTPEARALLATDRARKDHFLAARLAALTAKERATLAQAAALLDHLLELDHTAVPAARGGRA